MKAAVFYEHGGLDQLKYEESFPDPELRPGDVLVRVRAAGLNWLDVATRRGLPGIRVPLPMITGADVAGEVVDIGRETVGVQVGTRVLVAGFSPKDPGILGETLHGGLAEYVRCRPGQLIPLPDDVDFNTAAALPIAYGTAHKMLKLGRVGEGDKVLVLGAAGGVGVACVQLSQLVGAEVIACASSESKLAELAGIGAKHVVNYKTEDFFDAVVRLYGKPRMMGGGGVDVVVNYIGGDSWTKSLRCLAREGRVLNCGALDNHIAPTDLRYVWTYDLVIQGSSGCSDRDVLELLEMVRQGRLAPVIHGVFPLAQIREAQRLLEDREVLGKVIVTP